MMMITNNCISINTLILWNYIGQSYYLLWVVIRWNISNNDTLILSTTCTNSDIVEIVVINYNNLVFVLALV